MATKPGIRGLDRGRILLGCLQPGQTTAVYADVLARLADRLHYLNSSGDKTADSTRFWFDTRANLRREMEDRKQRFDRDRVLIRKTVLLKPSLNASSPEAVAASIRIFERVPFLFKTREEVLKLLGDPATISDYGQRAGADPDSPMIYRFDTGYGGIQYTIGFSGGKVDRVQAEPFS